jgi:hypothetical protein
MLPLNQAPSGRDLLQELQVDLILNASTIVVIRSVRYLDDSPDLETAVRTWAAAIEQQAIFVPFERRKSEYGGTTFEHQSSIDGARHHASIEISPAGNVGFVVQITQTDDEPARANEPVDLGELFSILTHVPYNGAAGFVQAHVRWTKDFLETVLRLHTPNEDLASEYARMAAPENWHGGFSPVSPITANYHKWYIALEGRTVTGAVDGLRNGGPHGSSLIYITLTEKVLVDGDALAE